MDLRSAHGSRKPDGSPSDLGDITRTKIGEGSNTGPGPPVPAVSRVQTAKSYGRIGDSSDISSDNSSAPTEKLNGLLEGGISVIDPDMYGGSGVSESPGNMLTSPERGGASPSFGNGPL